MRLAPRLKTLEGARLGFLSNTKKNNEAFVSELAAAVCDRSGLGETLHWRKSSVYRPLSKRMRNEIVSTCDAVVAGPGD